MIWRRRWRGHCRLGGDGGVDREEGAGEGFEGGLGCGSGERSGGKGMGRRGLGLNNAWAGPKIF